MVTVEEVTTKTFKLTERLFLNADRSAVVKEGDPSASFLFGGVGQEVSEEDVEKYGLLPQSKGKADDEELKGKLPEDFPGYAALVEAGITTYAKVRKAGELTEVPGIGKATAQKIAEALETE